MPRLLPLKKQNSELSTSVIRKGNFITQIRFSANAGLRQGAGMLMSNHFHIVIETIQGSLSAGMRQLNGVYTQWHNRAHGRVGHVFRVPPANVLEFVGNCG